MLSKIIALQTALTKEFHDFNVPEEHATHVFAAVMRLLGPEFMNYKPERQMEKLINQPPLFRESIIKQDTQLVEKSFALLYQSLASFATLLKTSDFGDKFTQIVLQTLEDLSMLADFTIVNATKKSVSALENKIAILLNGRKGLKTAHDIGEVQSTLRIIGVTSFDSLHPAAQTMVLMRGFNLGVLMQTFNGYEGYLHVLCEDLEGCPDVDYFHDLLPHMIACSLLHDSTIDLSLKVLLAWIQHEGLQAQN